MKFDALIGHLSHDQLEKMMMQKQRKNNLEKNQQQARKRKNRLLIAVTVLGSSGPLKFVVKEEELVSSVIDHALKLYAREGRLPALGSDPSHFLLHCPNLGSSEAVSPNSKIGSCCEGARNFILCKKANQPMMTEARAEMVSRKGNGNIWKAWFKISSH